MALEHLFQHLPDDERQAALTLLRVQVARRRRRAILEDAPETDVAPARSEKRCPRCDTVKLLDAFGVSTTRADGRQGYCRPCRRRGV